MKQSQIIKLSASAVKTYEQCPRKYFYNYIERAPRKQWDHFDLGNLCHKTLELFHLDYIKNKKKKQALGKIMSKSFKEARKDFPKMSVKLIEEAKDLIQDYLNKMKQDGMPNVKGVETYFNISLADDVLVRGYLDRLDMTPDGRYDIIDYKTTKNTKYLDEFQLLVYGLWLKEQYPDVEAFRGSYVLLRHGAKLKSYDFNMEDVDSIRKKLLGYAKSLKEENTWSPVPTALCNWCDFKNLCPTQQSW